VVFSGIVEAKARILSAIRDGEIVRIAVERPVEFDDGRPGDSIAVDGVCLTIEALDAHALTFALGPETLSVTGWSTALLPGKTVNLERSLRASDRVHGHFVTGHVDAMGEVVEAQPLGGALSLKIRAPASLAPYIWKKGSWALNGVSLTINEVEDAPDGPIVGHCLIPETLKRTNLGELGPGARPSIEVDFAARAFLRALETSRGLGLSAANMTSAAGQDIKAAASHDIIAVPGRGGKVGR
jgi:riboflavin synthase